MTCIILIGWLSADAEYRDIDGRKLLCFPVVYHSRYTATTGEENVELYDCIVERSKSWLNHLKSGKRVFLFGLPDIRLSQKENGEVVLSRKLNVIFISIL